MQNNKQEALNQINQSLELYDDDNSRALKGVILGGGTKLDRFLQGVARTNSL